MLKRDPFEAETLTIFRLFIGIQWLLLTLGLVYLLIKPRPVPDYLAILSWGLTTFLLAYLLLPFLSRVFGSFYLPFALVTISVGPVFIQGLTPALLVNHGVAENVALVDTGTFYVGLMLPLLLISLQYGIRTLFLFTGGTAFLSVLFSILITPHHKLIVTATILRSLDRFILFAIVGVIIVLLSQVRRRQQQELLRKNVQLAQYAATQEQLVVSQERNRMARDLHDTLAHTLSALNVQLKAAEVLCETDASAAQNALRQMQVLTSEGLHESRRALRALRASPIEELGLIRALQRLVEQTRQHAGFSISLNLPTQFREVTPDVEQHLYRITEEALSNIVRHANAKRLSLSLWQSDSELQLTIIDDGIGFETDKVLAHERIGLSKHHEHTGKYGLIGMRERAMLLDGFLTIRSKPMQGTTIQLCVNTNKKVKLS